MTINPHPMYQLFFFTKQLGGRVCGPSFLPPSGGSRAGQGAPLPSSWKVGHESESIGLSFVSELCAGYLIHDF